MTNGSSPDSAPGTADLLGLLAYAELVSFFRIADEAGLAPDLAAKGDLAGVAAEEYAQYRRLRSRLAELGADPEAAMEPFVAPLDAWHARTQPQNWLESLVKTYVGDGLAGDFYRVVARTTDPATAELVGGSGSESTREKVIGGRVRAAVEEDPKLAGPLSLWSRRLVGEALSQAQLVAAQRPELAALVVREAAGGDGGGESGAEGAGSTAQSAGEDASGDLAAVSRVFAGLTERHAARVAAMGLSS
ncbi:ferritin-like fold-containing protein [Nocardiopsis coralliicola]